MKGDPRHMAKMTEASVQAKRKRAAKKFSHRKIADALRNTDGNISAAARLLKISRGYLAQLLTPRHRELIEEISETHVDDAERVMRKLKDEGNFQAAAFLLKTKGKTRGYTERSEVRHGGDNQAPPIRTTDETKLDALYDSLMGAGSGPVQGDPGDNGPREPIHPARTDEPASVIPVLPRT